MTTPQNRTPEMLDMHSERVVNEKGDVWALGCLLYTLCYRVGPHRPAGLHRYLGCQLLSPCPVSPDLGLTPFVLPCVARAEAPF